MAVVNLSINRREYEIACEDGEEEKLMQLSYELDNRVRGLSRGVGTGNQTMLLIVAALQLIDEVYELRNGAAAGQNIQEQIDKITSAAMSQVTSRLHDLAERLEETAG